MAVETALVMPLLLTLGLGSFQVGEMVVRQSELESAAAEAAQITLAAKPDSLSKLTTIRDVLMTSTGITDSSKISLTFKYRCGPTGDLTDNSGTCGTETEWSFVQIILNDTYHPLWANFGVGDDVNLNVTRTVQIS